MILSILIPTLPDRAHFLKSLTDHIYLQVSLLKAHDKVEVITDPRPRDGEPGGVTTGEKRNDLYARARGTYSWCVDDDDDLFSSAIKNVLKAAEQNPDVIGINGTMTTDGINLREWEIRLGHPYEAIKKDGRDYYLRFPNHITPMKTEHARKVKFEHITVFEDYRWAKQLNDKGILKTQVVIEEPVYHYKERTKK